MRTYAIFFTEKTQLYDLVVGSECVMSVYVIYECICNCVYAFMPVYLPAVYLGEAGVWLVWSRVGVPLLPAAKRLKPAGVHCHRNQHPSRPPRNRVPEPECRAPASRCCYCCCWGTQCRGDESLGCAHSTYKKER